METILYKKAPSGGVHFWKITKAEWDCLEMEWGKVGGETQIQHEHVIAKANRTDEEQLQLQYQSKINKKLDSGYVYDLNDATANACTNMLGYSKPMLASSYDKVNDIDFDECYIQYKYDGHRCLVINNGRSLVAYSRNGKPIPSAKRLLEGLKIPVNMTLDGELYCHGIPLQQLSSWIKKDQIDSDNLQYVVYDSISSDPFCVRYHNVVGLDLPSQDIGCKIVIAPMFDVESHEELIQQRDLAIEKGYEGLMIRRDGYGYEDGKRSKSLIKVKSFKDDEFKVFDITASADGWAILHCRMESGKEFSVSAHGTMHNKTEILKNKAKHIGNYINVKYAMLTKDGIPFHPVATMWRNKFEE